MEAQGFRAEAYAGVQTGAAILSGFPWLLVGGLLFRVRARDPMALFAALALVLFATRNPFMSALATVHPAWALVDSSFAALTWGGFALLWMLFPNGRLVPRWGGWFALVWVALLLLPKEAPALVWLAPLEGLIWLVFFLTCLGAQLYRYWRVSTPAERQQTKWVVYGVGVTVTALVGIGFPYFLDTAYTPSVFYQMAISPLVAVVVPALIPISLGVAILRSRLWDIDVIIRRTFTYSVLTILLALMYFGTVVALEGLLRGVIGGESQVAIVLSTLVIAALFVPLRGRVQAAIDRRFYRRKYDAARTLAAFGAQARDVVELEQLTGQLVRVVDETMQPAHVGLWVRPPR